MDHPAASSGEFNPGRVNLSPLKTQTYHWWAHEAEIRDSMLKSPRDGRGQYRVAQPGEVVAAGGRVLSLVDLSDVFMTFFRPTAAAGKVALGSEVRLVFDAAPQYVIPARVSFVADVHSSPPRPWRRRASGRS